MSQDNRLTERSIKILREGECPNIRDGRIVSDIPEAPPEGHVVIGKTRAHPEGSGSAAITVFSHRF